MTRQQTRVVPRLPSPVLVLGAIGSVQLGSALAKTLFDRAGPLGATLLRLGVGAVMLLVLTRPRPGGRNRRQVLLVVAFGAALAALNGTFYSAIDRIPIGVAVTVEFAGPLGVAVVGSRRLLDLVWVALAASGVVLLTRLGGGALDPVGLGLAACAGVCWAAYILLSRRVGRAFAGLDGLALATVVGAVLIAPLGVAQAGAAQALDHPGAQVIADQVGVPVGGGQQPLHAVGGALAGVLGQLPADLLHVTQEPAVCSCRFQGCR